MIRRYLLLALPAACLTSQLSAQATFSGPLSPGAFEATMGTGPIASAVKQRAGTPAASAASSRFVRDPALFKAKQAKIVELMRQQSAQAAAEVEQLFAQDLIAMVRPSLREVGLDDQNAADMTAMYWIVAWEASHGIVGQKTDPAVARGARNQIAKLMAGTPQLAQASDRDKQDIADTMFLQAVLVEARMGSAAKAGPDMQRKMSDAVYAEAQQILKTDLRRVKLTSAGFAPETAGTSAASAGATAAATRVATTSGPKGAPAAHAANWAKVEGVYFKSFTGIGVGGMVTIDYEPLVLFRDGTYYEIGGEALEDVDLAASRSARPESWGRWSKSANSYTLTDNKGRADENKLQDGNFFKAFPAEANGNRLAAKYSRISGGGNSAMGGEMMISAQSNYTFAPDGRYSHGSSAGALGSGSVSGVGMAASSRRAPVGGTYRIEKHTITLTDSNGRTTREFFALGSHKNPPLPDPDMIFIGDRVFVDMD